MEDRMQYGKFAALLFALLGGFLATLPWALAAQMQPFNGLGQAQNEFDEGEDVFVYGTGFTPQSAIDILVVPEQETYTEGSLYDTQASSTVHTNNRGVLFLQKIWGALKGLWDLIADTNGNGRYDSSDVVVRGSGPGVKVGNTDPLLEGPTEVPEFAALASVLCAGGAGYLIWRKRK